jgi:hypothetical protein
LLNNTYPLNFIVCELFFKNILVMTYLDSYIWVNFDHNSCYDTFDCTWKIIELSKTLLMMERVNISHYSQSTMLPTLVVGNWATLVICAIVGASSFAYVHSTIGNSSSCLNTNNNLCSHTWNRHHQIFEMTYVHFGQCHS